MIVNVKVRGLPSFNYRPLNLEFNKDINIITGINGQGKTTLLKLIWYVYSGNLLKATDEIDFDYFEMETTTHLIKIVKCSDEKLKVKSYEVDAHSGYDIYVMELETGKAVLDTLADDAEVASIFYCSEVLANINKKSLFFPTFRRIEGFSSKKSRAQDKYSYMESEEQILNVALKTISSRISNLGHKYITSVSTTDINHLITTKYAEITESVNSNYKKLTDNIEETIYKNSQENDSELQVQLNKIKTILESNKDYRNKAFKPITTIDELVQDIFKRKGVSIGDTLSLGEKKRMIDSEFLSAGEKQMLSFISYNAFYNDTPIIIDEPEISLHADWQRKFLRILSSQTSGNQIIIATHSPFIYSKYGDKEIIKDVNIYE